MAGNAIYLASRSPRRRELLKQIGVGFEMLLLREDPRRGTDVNEAPQPDERPLDYVTRIATAKVNAGVEAMGRRAGLMRPVLSADTTVVSEGMILGKPDHAEHAVTMLAKLSGVQHTVITTVAMAFRDRLETRVSESKVTMRVLNESEIRRYVATGEPLDKAGAYAVQGRAAAFITRIEGSYSGVMGLPLAETAELLRAFSIETF